MPEAYAGPSPFFLKEDTDMSDPKLTIRYLGHRMLQDGGREFDFSFAHGGETPIMITVEAHITFFQGPDRIAIQEAAGICYETLKYRMQIDPMSVPDRFDLTSANVAQHRKITKPPGNRYSAPRAES
jgi:hypothetical protein